jgi:hypothetical protein
MGPQRSLRKDHNQKDQTLIVIFIMIGLPYLKVNDIYERIMSPIAVVLFIAWIEWCITTGIEGETFRHIGQWGAVVAAVLAALAAMITRYSTVSAERVMVMRTRLCKATSMNGVITERPPVLDTDNSEPEKLATVQIKGDVVRTIP